MAEPAIVQATFYVGQACKGQRYDRDLEGKPVKVPGRARKQAQVEELPAERVSMG